MICEPACNRDGAAINCIKNQENALVLAVFCLICFSICVQAAEGLHYGIVPYVSRPALGIVSGMVSAGGNLGAVVLLGSFFEDGTLRLDEGFLRLGMVVCGLTTLLVFVYFPDHGSMLLRAPPWARATIRSSSSRPQTTAAPTPCECSCWAKCWSWGSNEMTGTFGGGHRIRSQRSTRREGRYMYRTLRECRFLVRSNLRSPG